MPCCPKLLVNFQKVLFFKKQAKTNIQDGKKKSNIATSRDQGLSNFCLSVVKQVDSLLASLLPIHPVLLCLHCSFFFNLSRSASSNLLCQVSLVLLWSSRAADILILFIHLFFFSAPPTSPSSCLFFSPVFWWVYNLSKPIPLFNKRQMF